MNREIRMKEEAEKLQRRQGRGLKVYTQDLDRTDTTANQP